MDFKIMLALTTAAFFACLKYAVAGGLPSAAEDLAAEPNVNQTLLEFTSLTPLRFKRQSPLFLRCKRHSRAQLIRKLNGLGNQRGASYGGFNRRFMALTWKAARKFPNLVTTVSTSPLNNSIINNLPLNAPTKASTLTSRTDCHATENGLLRMCSTCPAVTFLGHDRIPSFINEVKCGQAMCSHGVFGQCQTATMLQQFLYKTGRCNPVTGYEELLPYTQPIRVCCECMVFPIG
ncbi:uncharacterized skeletal organic matrix protein 8-like [Stylophora pistillata]|uniref:uncharacterized skeletal organic matrix protein 8-like n=1 Tax=Stylophora pistillata TaxID=50429 RepID=UPI000C055690|nr:uncharacterized skeletal organic matrix protein 8-like [Stylophora pistillata]